MHHVATASANPLGFTWTVSALSYFSMEEFYGQGYIVHSFAASEKTEDCKKDLDQERYPSAGAYIHFHDLIEQRLQAIGPNLLKPSLYEGVVQKESKHDAIQVPKYANKDLYHYIQQPN